MSLDVFQQVFSLSLASNLVGGLKGTQTSLQAALQNTLVNQVLPTLPGWNLVWGPVVWKNEPDNADTGPENSWCVFFHPSLQFEDGSVRPAYVIAIAGTPVASEYVWVNQNFAVNAVADFNAWVLGGINNEPEDVPAAQIVPGTPYIAKGTGHGLYILLSNAAPVGAPGAGMTLLDFVSNVDTSEDVRFITTGHSLGGALSPSLALALVAAGVIPADNTLTYPSAGPSPGNEAFTNLFTATLPPGELSASSYQAWNRNLVNTLDIVPQAWAVQKAVSPAQNLGNIPTIYGTPALPLIQGITLVFALRALSSGVFYFPLPSQCFTGPPPSVTPTSLEKFLEIALPQHGTAYFDVVDVPVPVPSKSEVLRAGLAEKTRDEKRFEYPVIAGFEWAREHPEEAKEVIERAEGTEEAKTCF